MVEFGARLGGGNAKRPLDWVAVGNPKLCGLRYLDGMRAAGFEPTTFGSGGGVRAHSPGVTPMRSTFGDGWHINHTSFLANGVHLEEDTISTDLDFEYLLSGLFGKANCHGQSGHLDVQAWRSQLARIVHALGTSVRQTVQGDDRHRDQVVKLCREAEAKLQGLTHTKTLSVWAVYYLTRIAFSLVGQMPRHWDSKSTSNPQSWQLTDYRTLHYTRTVAQRAKWVQDLGDEPDKPQGMSSRNDLLHSFYEQCGSDPERFLDWFKKTYPKVYSDLASI
jgi:hypothetical protein